MQLNNPTVSIIIRTFNESKYIGELLKLCFSQKTNFDFEVVIVDSGSKDNTLEIASKFPVRIVHILPQDFTFGRSLNLGIENARGNFCVIISAHCFPINDNWLNQIILPFSNPNISIVYGKQRGDSRSKYSELQIFQKWFPEDSVSETDFAFCNNANSAIRKQDWKTYRFNEKLTGLEDLDWAKHFTSLGRKIAYQASATVLHIHEELPRQIRHRYFREAIAYQQIYPEETFSFYHFLLFFISNVIFDSLHCIRDGKIFSHFNSIISFRFNQFWGTYKAHANKKSIDKKMQRRLYYPRNPKTLLISKERCKNEF